MREEVAEIEAKIRALNTEEKAELIRSLLVDLDGPTDAEAERAWLEEATRRRHEIADGKVQTVPGERVFQNLRSRLKG
jgi:putative addiction module component (TIGR02574 family)